MQFDNLEQFLSMGGYGLYVWLAYGAFALVFVLLIFFSVRFRNTAFVEIRQAKTRAERLKEAAERRSNESTS